MKINEIQVELSDSEGETSIRVAFGNDGITISPEGMGTFDGKFGPILIERHEGRIRLIYWPDIDDQEPVIVDMSGALQSNSHFAWHHYEDGKCPDCGEDIPAEATQGGQCTNCHHVWAWGENDDEN